MLAPVLSRVFGYHLVVVDPVCQLESLQDNRILHKVVQSCTRAGLPDAVSLLANNEAMPWQTDSIDAFVLPHVLEVCDDPHQLLRELDRCLIPEGHLIILGFNPYGTWGLRRLLSGRRSGVPWDLRFTSLPRLNDWLSLLGYAMVQTEYFFPKLPWQRAGRSERTGIIQRLHRAEWPFFAGCYLLVARKRVTTLTPIKPRWRPRRSLITGGAVETPQRGVSRTRHG